MAHRWKLSAAALALFPVLIAPPALAEQAQHYEGKEAETLSEAVQNLRAYNERLARLLDKQDLSAAQMEEVHRLTYTLENALRRINDEIGTIAGHLETVHLASERREADTLNSHGKLYLEQTRTLIGE